jgi:hypothetical protein
MNSNDLPPPLEFLQLVTRYYVPQAIYVAARLGLADRLAGSPRSADELAQATGTHAPTLELLLRSLASVGLFTEEADRGFSLTPLGSYLRSDVPHSQLGWALSHGETGYRAWGELFYTVQTGQPAFERAFGASYYDYIAMNPESAERWGKAMDQTARDWLGTLPESYNFSGIRTIVDVGGAHGMVLAHILKAAPTAHGILFDLPHAVAGAPPTLEAAGVADRCEIVGGDMFISIPEGGDAYLLARVLFNWDDQHAAAILQNCRRAMTAGAKLIVVDIVEADSGRPLSAAFGDLNLLLTFGGHQRSAGEFRALFEAAGLCITNILPTKSHFKIVEGMLT